MDNKLVVVIMGQNCERFITMCIDAVKDADAIVYCDGGSTDKTIQLVYENFEMKCKAGIDDCHIIENAYDQNDLGMNGKQRNYYLNHVRRRYPDYWCLALDADEIVEDLSEIKKFINIAPSEVYSVKMRHLISDLAHEDATNENHFVPNRLFKISEADSYPEVEHPILKPLNGEKRGKATDCTNMAFSLYS